jgi:hypothetical protein
MEKTIADLRIPQNALDDLGTLIAICIPARVQAVPSDTGDTLLVIISPTFLYVMSLFKELLAERISRTA